MAAINVAAVAGVAPVHAPGRPRRSCRKKYRTLRERDGPVTPISRCVEEAGPISFQSLSRRKPRRPRAHCLHFSSTRGAAADRNTAASVHSPSLVVAIFQPVRRAAVVVCDTLCDRAQTRTVFFLQNKWTNYDDQRRPSGIDD